MFTCDRKRAEGEIKIGKTEYDFQETGGNGGRAQVLLRRKENKDVFCHAANNYIMFKTCYDIGTK